MRIMVGCLRTMARCALLLAVTGTGGFGVLAADPAVRTFEIDIRQGDVPKDMRTIKVEQGDMVRIRITSDEAVSLHLHGYDIEKAVKPGGVAEFSFEAYAAGRFPVSVHGSQQSGGLDEPTLLRLEVYPR